MKKNILSYLGLAFILCGYTNKVVADTFIRAELLSETKKDPISVAEGVAEKSKDLGKQIDLYLEYLLTIPFEQRQYLFPALFDAPNIPKKIRTHPEIAIWEGKMPTDIDPKKRELADKYMKDLNPALYIYLAPKGPQEEADMPIKNQEAPLFPGEGPRVIGEVTKYPTVYETLKQPENLKKNPKLSHLKKNDIGKIELGLEIFGNYLKKIQQNPSAREKYQLLASYYTDPNKERINPFQAKIERLRLINRIQKLEQELKKVGFKSAEDFGRKTDILVKAYRASRMSYGVALQARKYKDITPKNKTEQMLALGSRMHQAYPQDTRLVQDNLEAVRQIFIKNNFQSVLDAETFDALRN